MRPNISFSVASAIVVLFAGIMVSVAQTAPDAAKDQKRVEKAAPDRSAVGPGNLRMVVLKNKDIHGEVLKRVGLPNQNYCWEQCLSESRCSGTRWGVLEGSTAGQCQLITGEFTVDEPHELKTDDGTRIQVTASRKQSAQQSAP
ncbi:MAG: hypothetical protein IRZ28_11520 [Steroidobacteraceae bacterium]|nr:hypothetical protein [Steroidobacteraceae bacterium]